jgi:cytochrome c
MCSWRDPLAALTIALLLASVASAGDYTGIGRAATAAELAAWDTDVRPDFKGLPPGSGSVAQGQRIWEQQCAGCHGVFGESNEVFHPLVGGTTDADIARGRVARLYDPSFPARTTLMKLSTVSTVWDYIARAMPWNAPKSLRTDEVYAVTAYLLHLGGIVADDFVLDEHTIAQVQQRLPNRLGTTTAHALWPGPRQSAPDVRARACQRDCAAEPRIASALPAHARNAHGNLAEQNRSVGAQHGVDTRQAVAQAAAAPGAASAPAVRSEAERSAWTLAGRHGCTVCHGIDAKVVGPAFRDIARKHATRDDAVSYLQDKIRSGGSGLWGNVPMPPQSVTDADARSLAQWIAQGARP